MGKLQVLEPGWWNSVQPVKTIPGAQHQRSWQWDGCWTILEVSTSALFKRSLTLRSSTTFIELSNHLSQPNRTIKIQARRWLWYWPMATWLWPNLSLLSQQRGAPHEWWDRGGWICSVGSPWIPHPCLDSGLLCHLEGTTQFWKGTTVTTSTINFAQHKAQEMCNNILTHILDVYISQFLCCNLMTRKSKQ